MYKQTYNYIMENWYRLTLFLFGCIGTRLAIGLFIRSRYSVGVIATIMALLLCLMGSGFIIIFLGGLRKTGAETGGDVIWWNNLRPFHGVMYLMAGFYLYKGQTMYSSTIILADTLFGLVAWLLYHGSQLY
jgi:hypothetical protein